MESTVPLKVQEAIFNQLLDRPENKVCADCPNKSPTWASIDFGVFICLRCSGAHRRLSPVVTRVRSAKIDSWKMEHIEMLAAVGNKIGNDYWEYNAPSYYKKPDISTSLEEVFEFVKNKYVKALYAPKDCLNPVKEFLEAKKDGQTTAGSFSQAKMGKKSQATEKTTTSSITNNQNKKPSFTQNLMDFEVDNDLLDFKSAPEKDVNLDIPKPEIEIKFVSNIGFTQKKTIDLLDMNSETQNSSSNLQKVKAVEPFSFNGPQKDTAPLSNQRTNDSNKQSDLYNRGILEQNSTKPGNVTNYSGRQSNYAYLDMLSNQQNRFYQQQSFGSQNNLGVQSASVQYNGVQGKPTNYGNQSVNNKLNGGFEFDGSNNSFSSSGFGGGFNASGYGNNSNGINSFNPNGLSFGSQNTKTNGNNYSTQQQQQPFSFNQSTTIYSFIGADSTQILNQPSANVSAGFSFI